MLTIFTGCKKNDLTPEPVVPQPQTNDATLVTASVSGIVLDETNIPIQGAVVTSASATATTNIFGMFNFNNISLSENNGNVTVTKAGFFKGIRSFKTTANNLHQVKIQLMKKVLSGTINAVTGGTITSNGGASIVFPAAAFVTSAGVTYSGSVNVYTRWIDPTAVNLPFIIPGDLRGISTTGSEKVLETYGMIGAELEDVTGNTLKLATGKTATLNSPIPASIIANAPATIPMWHFDEAAARWKEEGTATKNGNTYITQVNHFSFWNYDISANGIILDFTLINASNGNPLIGVTARIKRTNNGSVTYGTTNNVGFVSGYVPKNESLVLEVLSNCNSVIYTQNIGPYLINTGLGNISINIASNIVYTITGVLRNCTSNVVTNGYVEVYLSTGNSAIAVVNNVTGAFTLTVLGTCVGSNLSYSILGTDNTTLQQGNVYTGSLTTTNTNIGSVVACGTSIDQYINLVIDGVPLNFNSPVDTFSTDQLPSNYPGYNFEMDLGAAKSFNLPSQKSVVFSIYNKNNLSNGLLNFFVYEATLNGVEEQSIAFAPVIFTQFGSSFGTYVAGSFSCSIQNANGTGPIKSVTCSFKLKRLN